MNSDDVTRVLVEVETGKPPAVPDTPELLMLRAKLTGECVDIRAKGGWVDVPHEIPGFEPK
jgi:hypothetical protein